MENYDVVFRRSALKDLRRFPGRDVAMILCAIEALRREPRPPQAQKLTDQERWRLRKGRYRILYEITDVRLIIIVVKIAHRKESYG